MLSPQLKQQIEDRSPKGIEGQLSPVALRVARYYGQGMSVENMALRLQIDVNEVRRHLAKVAAGYRSLVGGQIENQVAQELALMDTVIQDAYEIFDGAQNPKWLEIIIAASKQRSSVTALSARLAKQDDRRTEESTIRQLLSEINGNPLQSTVTGDLVAKDTFMLEDIDDVM